MLCRANHLCAFDKSPKCLIKHFFNSAPKTLQRKVIRHKRAFLRTQRANAKKNDEHFKALINLRKTLKILAAKVALKFMIMLFLKKINFANGFEKKAFIQNDFA